MNKEKLQEKMQQTRAQETAVQQREVEEYLLNAIRRLGRMDNRELAWLLLNTQALQDGTPMDEAIIEEAAHRLYSEWNGCDVQLTEYG